MNFNIGTVSANNPQRMRVRQHQRARVWNNATAKVDKHNALYERIAINIINNACKDTPQITTDKFQSSLSLCELSHNVFKSPLTRDDDPCNIVKMWETVCGKVSPELFAAFSLLHVFAKSSPPLFCTESLHYLTQFTNIINNVFISKTIRNEFITQYCRLKRTYAGFSKCARIWRLRKIPVQIQTDLYMNELDRTSISTFQLIQPGGIYLFSLSDLARIIVEAITHQSGMFIEPLPIKNPYTNGLLSKPDLFNIYLRLTEVTGPRFRIPEMLEKLFRCEFNIFDFRSRYDTELRDFAINQYANTGSIDELACDVMDMLSAHKMTRVIKICSGFPHNTLVTTMRPLLRLYLLECYSFSSMTRKYSTQKLKLGLKEFVKNNPKYGRRVTSDANLNTPFSESWTPSVQIPISSVVPNPFAARVPPRANSKFVTEVQPQSKCCIANYMKSHVYDEDVFNRYVETGDATETYSFETRYSDSDVYVANEVADTTWSTQFIFSINVPITPEADSPQTNLRETIDESVVQAPVRNGAFVQAMDILARNETMPHGNRPSATITESSQHIQEIARAMLARLSIPETHSESESESDDDIVINNSTDSDDQFDDNDSMS